MSPTVGPPGRKADHLARSGGSEKGNWYATRREELVAIARRGVPVALGVGSPSFEISVLSYVPRHFHQVARRGCAACPSGALVLIEDFSEPLAAEIRELFD